MATMTLPIRELEMSVRVDTDKARAEAECVVFYSQARATGPVRMTVKLGVTALLLKFILARMARHQRLLIRALQDTDLSHCKREDLMKLAESLDHIAEGGRPIMSKLGHFGPRGHKLWNSSLLQLDEQLDHLGSIATSLRSAADPETSLLMGLAVAEMATSQARA
jgi:hypothetical protein